MFAFVVPGRLVQQAQQDPTSPERFLAQIEQATELNHITVFLTGQAPFPPGYGATVHLEIPGKGFQLIGGLSNEKPSAIFRLRGTTITPSSTAQFQGAGATGATANSNVATLGILCEPLESIATQLAGLASTSGAPLTTSNALVPAAGASSSSTIGLGGAGGPPPSADATVQLAQLIGKNLFNAVAGFVKPLANVPGDGWIEFGQVENWYRNFETKLRTRGAGFLLQSD